MSSSYVGIHAGSNERSQALALSLSKKGNTHKRMALVETPLSSKVLHTSKKIERCKFGSSNWDCCTIDIGACLSSKLFGSMVGRVMLEQMPQTPRVTKSQSVLLLSPPILAIDEETT